MRLNELNQASTISNSDLVLIWASQNSQARTATFGLMVDAAQEAVYQRIGTAGALAELGIAASGPNSDITRLTGITTAEVTTDANAPTHIGWFLTTAAAANTPTADVWLIWHNNATSTSKAQVAVNLNTGEMATRKYAVGTGTTASWSAWAYSLQDGDITAGTIEGAGAAGVQLLESATVANALAVLGLSSVGTTGAAIVAAADGATVRSLIGGTTGASLLSQGSVSGVWAVLGVTSAGSQLISVSGAAAQRTQLGATTVGNALFTATDAAAALTTLGTYDSAYIDALVPANATHATTADSATALATARTVALTGGATASGTFNGSANLSLAVTLATPTDSVLGGVTLAAAIADVTDAPTADDFNGLLAALRTSGLLAAA